MYKTSLNDCHHTHIHNKFDYYVLRTPCHWQPSSYLEQFHEWQRWAPIRIHHNLFSSQLVSNCFFFQSDIPETNSSEISNETWSYKPWILSHRHFMTHDFVTKCPLLLTLSELHEAQFPFLNYFSMIPLQFQRAVKNYTGWGNATDCIINLRKIFFIFRWCKILILCKCWYPRSRLVLHIQGSFCVCTQSMRDDVTTQRLLSLAGGIQWSLYMSLWK